MFITLPVSFMSLAGILSRGSSSSVTGGALAVAAAVIWEPLGPLILLGMTLGWDSGTPDDAVPKLAHELH